MGKVDLIYQMIKAGVSAPKIIAKYGKKAYTTAKKQWSAFKKSEKEQWKDRVTLQDIKDYHGGGWKLARNLTSIPTGATIAGLGLNELEKRGYISKFSDKKNKDEKLEKKKGGSVNSRAIAKKYFKGGLV